MNSLILSVDAFCLHLTKKIARVIYLYVGLTNFQLSRFFFRIVTIFVLLNCYAMSIERKAVWEIMLYGFSKMIWVLILWMTTIKGENNTSTARFANPCRKGWWVLFRVGSILIACLCLVLVIRTLILYIDPFYENLNFWTTTSFHVSLAINFCLASIEPEPPSESKVRKAWNKLKLVFNTDALPQPV